MTRLLEKAFAEAAKLSEKEQDALAAILLTEIASEARWRRAFSESPHKLAALGDEALEEFLRGRTEPLDPDQL